MEHGVHVFALVDGVEYGAGDVADTFGHNPDEVGRGECIHQRLESHEHAQPHAHETRCFEKAVILEVDETHHRSHQGTQPDEHEQAPTPITLFTQCDERDGRIAAGDVPIYGGMVPPSQPLFPLAPGRKSMVGRRGDVRHEHAE